jgi:hypothetical protein
MSWSEQCPADSLPRFGGKAACCPAVDGVESAGRRPEQSPRAFPGQPLANEVPVQRDPVSGHQSFGECEPVRLPTHLPRTPRTEPQLLSGPREQRRERLRALTVDRQDTRGRRPALVEHPERLVDDSRFFGAFAGTRLRQRFPGEIAIGTIAMVMPIGITAVYHLGYSDFRSEKVRKPVLGDVAWSAPTLVTLSPLGAPIAHIGLHTSAVVNSYETDVFLPPHTNP